MEADRAYYPETSASIAEIPQLGVLSRIEDRIESAACAATSLRRTAEEAANRLGIKMPPQACEQGECADSTRREAFADFITDQLDKILREQHTASAIMAQISGSLQR